MQSARLRRDKLFPTTKKMKTTFTTLLCLGLLLGSPLVHAAPPAGENAAPTPAAATATSGPVEIITFRLKPKLPAAKLTAAAQAMQATADYPPGLQTVQLLMDDKGGVLLLHWRSEAERLRDEEDDKEPTASELAFDAIAIESTIAVRVLQPMK
jgi:hypothetical protein